MNKIQNAVDILMGLSLAMLVLLLVFALYTGLTKTDKIGNNITWTRNAPDTTSVLKDEVCYTWLEDTVQDLMPVRYKHYTCRERK